MAELAIIASIASTAFSFVGGMQDAAAQEAYGKQQQVIAEMQARNARVVADRNALIATDQANYSAKQQEVEAGQERSVAQREALQERKRRDVALSRARAVGASSTGDTLDPTSLNIAGQITEQGELNALNAMFTGESGARALESNAGLTRYEGTNKADMFRYGGATDASLLQYQGAAALAQGKAAASSARIGAVGSLFSGGSDIYNKYAPKKGYN